MEGVLIDIREQNDRIKKCFNGKDLVSVEDLLNAIDDLMYEVDDLEHDIRNLENDIEDNYRPIDKMEMYGLSENDFH